MKASLKVWMVIGVGGLMLTLGFQNCAPTEFQNSNQMSSTGNEKVVALGPIVDIPGGDSGTPAPEDKSPDQPVVGGDSPNSPASGSPSSEPPRNETPVTPTAPPANPPSVVANEPPVVPSTVVPPTAPPIVPPPVVPPTVVPPPVVPPVVETESPNSNPPSVLPPDSDDDDGDHHVCKDESEDNDDEQHGEDRGHKHSEKHGHKKSGHELTEKEERHSNGKVCKHKVEHEKKCRDEAEFKKRCMDLNVLSIQLVGSSCRLDTQFKDVEMESSGLTMTVKKEVSVSSVRVILSSTASSILTTDHGQFPIRAPSASTSGLKVYLEKPQVLKPGVVYTLVLPPDALKLQAKGKFCMLHPVVRGAKLTSAP